MTEVVAGVLEHGERVLICQRRADQPHAGKWEFPGGKIEPGEQPAAALERELREELGIHSAIGQELLRYEFAYPGKKPILLIFLRVNSFTGPIQNLIFARVEWVTKDQLKAFDMLEGDAPFLDWYCG